MKILRIEIVRSPLRRWFPFLVALDLAVLFGRGRWWIGVWPQASAAAQIAAFYLGPVAAFGAAWAAGEGSRRGTALLLGSAARPRWRAEGSRLLATLTWVLAAYAVGAIAAAVSTMATVGPGLLWPSYLLLGAALIVGCGAVGHLVGRWSTSRLIIPIACGLGCFLAVALVGNRLQLDVLVGEPNQRLGPAGILARWAVAGALAGVALFVSRPRHGWRPRRRDQWQLSAAGLSACALLVSLGAFDRAGPLLQRRPVPAAPLCTATTPNLCVWPEHKKYLAQLRELAQRTSALPAPFQSPAAMYESGLRPPRYVSNGEPIYDNNFVILEGQVWDVGNSIAGDVMQVTPGARNCPWAALGQQEAEQLSLRYGELLMWLTARITGGGRPAALHGAPPGVDVSAAAAVARQPAQQQHAWVEQRMLLLRGNGCR